MNCFVLVFAGLKSTFGVEVELEVANTTLSCPIDPPVRVTDKLTVPTLSDTLNVTGSANCTIPYGLSLAATVTSDLVFASTSSSAPPVVRSR